MNFSAKNIFLLDGIGALITGLLLSQVLARFESLFGMPKEILWVLSGVAFLFALYSITCHVIIKKNFGKYLKVIMVANLLYCLVTSVLMILLFNSLTWLGIAYFIGEIIIIVILVMIESRVLSRSR
jgi:hypothetical protein